MLYFWVTKGEVLTYLSGAKSDIDKVVSKFRDQLSRRGVIIPNEDIKNLSDNLTELDSIIKQGFPKILRYLKTKGGRIPRIQNPLIYYGMVNQCETSLWPNIKSRLKEIISYINRSDAKHLSNILGQINEDVNKFKANIDKVIEVMKRA